MSLLHSNLEISLLLKLGNANNKIAAVLSSGADPGFDKGGFDIVPKSDTGGATHNYL